MIGVVETQREDGSRLHRRQPNNWISRVEAGVALGHVMDRTGVGYAGRASFWGDLGHDLIFERRQAVNFDADAITGGAREGRWAVRPIRTMSPR